MPLSLRMGARVKWFEAACMFVPSYRQNMATERAVEHHDPKCSTAFSFTSCEKRESSIRLTKEGDAGEKD